MENYVRARLLIAIIEIEVKLQEEYDFYLNILEELRELKATLDNMYVRSPRTVWVKEWVKKRKEKQPLMSLFRDLQVEAKEEFRSFIRVDYETFQELVRRVGPRIKKKDTNWREAISPTERLLLTLQYLTEGGPYRTKKFLRLTPHNTISGIIKETCEAIYDEYQDEYLRCPTTPEQWKAVAGRFQDRWQFPHTLGALDGKHVAIKCPAKSGSTYYNYKGFYSIVLMALVDADYKFLWIEVGGNGASSDAQVFNDSDLLECYKNGTLRVPADDRLPGDDRYIPYYFVGDDAFGIQTYMMKPFSQRGLSTTQQIFNYRLSRARRIVENAFGILANRFGVLLTTMKQKPETAASIVKACVILHNLLRTRRPLAPGIVDEEINNNMDVRPGFWRQFTVMHDMEELAKGNVGTRQARQQRQYLAHYLQSPAGSVPWQDEYINRHRNVQ